MLDVLKLRAAIRGMAARRYFVKEPNMTDHRPTEKNALPVLVNSHRKFLSFLEKRIGNRSDAEEILQAAFAKAVEHQDSLKVESVVAWFFRVLRNALVDHYRRKTTEQNAMEALRREVRQDSLDDAELDRTICECFQDLLPTLKPEYAEVVQAVDLEGQSVADLARKLGITANNAGVRLHRARLGIKQRLEESCRTCAEHGCLDCTCKNG